MPQLGISHSTSNCCSCASPRVATTAYWGNAIRRPCRYSWSSVLGSLPVVAGSIASIAPPSSVRTTLLRGLETLIKERRADHRLDSIGQHRWAPCTAALGFPLAEEQLRSEVELLSHVGERLLVDEVRPEPRQLAFGQLRKFVIELERDSAIHDAVAEEFEALVVGGAVAAVRQRTTQQFRLAEAMADPEPDSALSIPRRRTPRAIPAI